MKTILGLFSGDLD